MKHGATRSLLNFSKLTSESIFSLVTPIGALSDERKSRCHSFLSPNAISCCGMIRLNPSVDDLRFPHVELASPEGLLAVGGDLRPERLLEAYRHGIFPWYEKDQPILWWSPDPRTVSFRTNSTSPAASKGAFVPAYSASRWTSVFATSCGIAEDHDLNIQTAARGLLRK